LAETVQNKQFVKSTLSNVSLLCSSVHDRAAATKLDDRLTYWSTR